MATRLSEDKSDGQRNERVEASGGGGVDKALHDDGPL